MASDLKAAVVCEFCEEAKPGVMALGVVWTAWGRNSFDFNWRKTEGWPLCEGCEADEYQFCEYCGAGIERMHYGIGYLPDDTEQDPSGYDGRTVCPECAPKHGLTLSVRIADPPTYANTPEANDA